MPRRRSPKTPEQIQADKLAKRRLDFDAANLDPTSADLPAFADVEVERTGRRNVLRAWRSDVFRLLLERKSITKGQAQAAETLVEHWAAWRGLTTSREVIGERIDRSGSAELVTDAMISAGRKVTAARESMPQAAWRVLEAFMVIKVEECRPMAWRGVLERLGHRDRDTQAKVVADACEHLRRHYQEPRRKAA